MQSAIFAARRDEAVLVPNTRTDAPGKTVDKSIAVNTLNQRGKTNQPLRETSSGPPKARNTTIDKTKFD